MKLLAGFAAIALAASFVFAAVNINTANEKELATLKGIGKAKAAAIVKYREINGEFKTIDELKNIRGISDKIIEDNRADLSLKGATTVKTPKDKKEKPIKKDKEPKPNKPQKTTPPKAKPDIVK